MEKAGKQCSRRTFLLNESGAGFARSVAHLSFLLSGSWRVVPISRSPAGGSLHRTGCEDER